MKLTKSDIDELLKKHLANRQEAEMSRERFLKLLKARNNLRDALAELKGTQNPGKSEFSSLGYVDQLVLTAIHLLHGGGSSLKIAEKVNKILNNRTFDTGAVIVALDNLERSGLISSPPSAMLNHDEIHMFKVTPEGEDMLREVRSAAQQLMEALNEKTFRKA